MPISAAQLMAARPSAKEEQNQFVDLAQLMRERFSQQIAEIVASLTKVSFEPRYFPPPPTSPPLQRQRTVIVINLIVDLPLQG